MLSEIERPWLHFLRARLSFAGLTCKLLASSVLLPTSYELDKLVRSQKHAAGDRGTPEGAAQEKQRSQSGARQQDEANK